MTVNIYTGNDYDNECKAASNDNDPTNEYVIDMFVILYIYRFL